MADTTYVTIPELTKITRAETTDTAMLETAVEDQLTPTGYGSRRITLSSIASYVLSNFSSLSLGGVTRTVKAAIDAIATLLGSSSMGTTATTVTGAIAEHEGDITTLTNSVNDLNSHLSTITSHTITTASGYASSVSSNLISCYKRSDGIVFVFGSFTLSSAIASSAAANIFEGFPISRFGSVWVSIMHVSTKETLRIQFRNGSSFASLQENYTAYASGEYVVLPFAYLS